MSEARAGGTVDLAEERGIATLTLNRPQKRNALDYAMIEALAARCREIERSTTIRVVLLQGSGGSFCAGGDIRAWSEESAEDFGRHWVRIGHEAFDRLARLRQPVIAVLDGHALGGGLELAACADLRIAEDHVKIGQPETGLGVIPGWSGAQRAVRRFGPQLVRRMALFGEVFQAADAFALGLVDQVVPTGKARAAARARAEGVLSRGPRATELVKMLINAAEGEERERVLESVAGSLAMHSPDLDEGVAAFKEKRSPDFTKRP